MAAEHIVRTCCMAPWSWWASLSESDQAQWAGAIGAIVAVAVAASFWAMERWLERRRASEAERQAQTQRSMSAWRQALMIRPMLEVMSLRLKAIDDELTKTPSVLVTPGSEMHWYLSEPEEIQRQLTDPLAFGTGTSKVLLDLIAMCYVVNVHTRLMLADLKRLGGVPLRWTAPPGYRDGIKRVRGECESLAKSMSVIAES